MDSHALAVLLAAHFTYSFQSEDTYLMDIGTNATWVGVVALSGNALINGDVEVGPGGKPATDITTNGNTAVNGNKGTAETTKDMTPMTDPGGGVPETLSVSGNNTKTISSGTYRLPNISISGNATGEISGDVTLWPEECVLLGTSSCTSIIISGNGDLYAAIDASTAITSVTGNGDVYGSLVGDTGTISGNGDVLFDESLQNLTVGEISDFNVTLCKYLNM